ncbi:MAG: hypothetical protein UHN88_03580 [Eubacterium sp.]|nr:hypothetical protein [Eubacterium sp.]
MADTNKTYKCPSCGGELQWSPTAQKMVCPYCGSEFELSVFEKTEEAIQEQLQNNTYAKGEDGAEMDYGAADATDESNIDPHDLRVYKCSVCGAEVVTDKTTVATSCAFCGSPVVLTEQLDTQFRPKWIVPFAIEQSKLRELYMNYVKSRPFTPGSFFTDAHLEKLKGVYVPFWMYDLDMQGHLSATGERLSSYSDSRYFYTVHRVYDIERGGTLSLRNIPVDSSSRTPDDAMDSIEPFDLSQIKPFKTAYMAGFLAERYDEDPEDCKERALNRAKQTVENELRSTIGGYSGLQILGENIVERRESRELNRVNYALLPVYMLNAKYKGKDYLFAMNGQTGVSVGDVPISTGKAIGFFGIAFGILWVIFSLLAIFLF